MLEVRTLRELIPDSWVERRIMRVPETGCWLWQGARQQNRGNYGILTFQSKVYRAHRFFYELYKGPIPEGLLVRHSCDNPPCVNPDHLLVGNQADNIGDAFARGAHGRNFEITHCARGHEFTKENTYIIPASGSRQCRTCVKLTRSIHALFVERQAS